MTFPAEQTFKRDRVLSPTARRVYDYLTTALDFRDIRPVKLDMHLLVRVDRGKFLGALDQLVARGFLIEHARGERNVRRFTLAWSVDDSVSRERAG